MQTEITAKIAQKVLTVVDAGLVRGLGDPNPGQMCVEAAVCYALDLPHGDNPTCVAPTLRDFKIRLNDSSWSSPAARAKGLRRLAVAQLGSAGALDEKEFVRRVVDYAIRKSVPFALRAAASVQKDTKHKAALLDAAIRCENEGTQQALLDAKNAASAAYATADAAAADAATYAAAAAANAANAAKSPYANASAAYASATAAYAAAANTTYAAADAAYASATAAYAAAADAATCAATYAANANAANAAYASATAANAAAANAANANAANAAAAAAYAAYTDTATAAYAAAYASAARDKSLAEYAEDIVNILIDMKAPGCQWLSLADITT